MNSEIIKSIQKFIIKIIKHILYPPNEIPNMNKFKELELVNENVFERL